MKIAITCSFLFTFLFFSSMLFSQQRGVLVVTGKMEAANRPVTAGAVKVYEAGNLIEEVKSSILGRFEFYVQFDNNYMVEFTSPGLVTKRLEFDTHLPEGISRRNYYEFDFVIELFTEVEEVDLSFFDEPLAEIKFDEEEHYDFIFPSELYADNLARAVELQEEVERVIRRDQRYRDLVRVADEKYDGGDLSEALENYVAASEIYPDREHPLERILEIRETLAEMDVVQQEYRELIELADNNFSIEEYETALVHYRSASEVRPEADYPRQRINEIDRLIAQQEAEAISQARRDSILRAEAIIKEQYDSLIALADDRYEENLLTQARDYYAEALEVIPGEQYPEDRMLAINRRLREEMETETLYSNIINRADSLFEIQRYSLAQNEYREALEVMPEESYPEEQIAVIDGLIAEQRQREEEYQGLISEADTYFSARNYESARTEYEKALEIKPGEEHPRQRLEELSVILGRRERQLEAYNEAVRRGDRYFNESNYVQARESYRDASNIRPDDEYTKNKLAEIEELLAATAAESRSYQEIVDIGDRLFNQREYSEARDAYHRALNVNPGAEYPLQRIREINELILSGEEIEAFYSRGYMEVSEVKEVIENNSERIYHIVPFSRHRSGSYIELNVLNEADRNIRIFVNYGVDGSRHGGIAVTVPPSNDYQNIRLNVSSQPSWIRFDNNWISLAPVGGGIDIEYIRVVFGN